MFNNLTKREKILAIVVLSLVPISVIFVGVFSFISSYNNNTQEIIRLENNVADEEQKVLLAMKAKRRLDYYTQTSLASEFSKSSNDYQLWLLNLIRERGLEVGGVVPKGGMAINFENKEIGRAQQVEAIATGTLSQVIQFLTDIYSTDILHRVTSLRLDPEMRAVRGGNTKVRTGRIRMIAKIEVAALNDAPADAEFTIRYRDMMRSSEEYLTKIVGRNIFGPPNNTPVISARPSRSYVSNESVSLRLDIEDPDENDEITIELVNSEIEGAVIEAGRNSRQAFLSIPGQPAGTYKVTVSAKDSGFPPKEDVAEFEIVFEDKPNRKPSLIVDLERSYPPNRTIEISIEGRDDDRDDELVFELLEGIEGAELVEVDDAPRKRSLIVPGLDVGEYEFLISVSDGREQADEEPPTKDFVINVVRRFTHFAETRITSIMRDTAGVWQVNISVRTTGQRFSLVEGDSFNLEGQTWSVISITRNEVVFQAGNKILTLTPGTPFTNPDRTETIAIAGIEPDQADEKETAADSTQSTERSSERLSGVRSSETLSSGVRSSETNGSNRRSGSGRRDR